MKKYFFCYIHLTPWEIFRACNYTEMQLLYITVKKKSIFCYINSTIMLPITTLSACYHYHFCVKITKRYEVRNNYNFNLDLTILFPQSA